LYVFEIEMFGNEIKLPAAATRSNQMCQDAHWRPHCLTLILDLTVRGSMKNARTAFLERPSKFKQRHSLQDRVALYVHMQIVSRELISFQQQEVTYQSPAPGF
jgi:hypothetical protein